MKEIVFNPQQAGPMKIIADMDDANYYEKRAIEEIAYATAIRIACINELEYHQRINKAIQLLLLAKCSEQS